MPRIFSVFLFIAITSLTFSGCVKETTAPNDDNPGGNNTRNYNIERFKVFTSAPAFVNIFFRVTHRNNQEGVTELTTADFRVLENSRIVSEFESNMEVDKSDAINYVLKTVLLLDNSTSVGSNINEIKNAAVKMVEQISPVQEFAIYTFSEYPEKIHDFSSDAQSLIAAIEAIGTGAPSTDLYGAVIEGASQFEDLYTLTEIVQGFLVLLTDGRDTQFSHSLNEAFDAISGKQVYTVGVGQEIDRPVLLQLGTAGNYSISNFSQLEQTFTEIQHSLELYANSFYWLHYLSPTRGNNDHYLDLSILHNTNIYDNYKVEYSFNSSLFYTSTSPGNEIETFTNVVFASLADTLYGMSSKDISLVLTGVDFPEDSVSFKFLGFADSLFYESIQDDECLRRLARTYPTGYITSIRDPRDGSFYSVFTRGKYGLIHVHDSGWVNRWVNFSLKIHK